MNETQSDKPVWDNLEGFPVTMAHFHNAINIPNTYVTSETTLFLDKYRTSSLEMKFCALGLWVRAGYKGSSKDSSAVTFLVPSANCKDVIL